MNSNSQPFSLMNVKNPLNLKANSHPVIKHQCSPWRVVIVDDDADIHILTRLVLAKIVFKHRPIELLHAYSASEARQLLGTEKNIAIVLLDVVMETNDAGLRLVRVIRDELKNVDTRIILRTGQPGQAPEEQIIIDYDINDYKAKSELTAQKLFTSIIAALRAYETIMSLNKTRLGLEKILHSSDSLFKIQSMQEFSSGVLTQLSSFLGCQPQGVMCIEEGGLYNDAPCCLSFSEYNLKIVAATDEFQCFLQYGTTELCRHSDVKTLIQKTLVERRNQFHAQYTAFYLDSFDNKATIVLVCSDVKVDESDRCLLEVFTSKISIALANAIHYQKMISFEQASTIDFLTGLYNRRHLLRLGSLLLSNAQRNTTAFAVAILDVDFFKKVNDRYGHDVGDAVLQEVGKLLTHYFKRDTDVVARYGGEEFCILVSNVDVHQAFELFEQFRTALENHVITLVNQTLQVTVSIGVSTTVCKDLDDMIVNADRLMYQAKRAGRNRVLLA